MRNPLLAGLKPTHPGELLRVEILPALRSPKPVLARRLGISLGRLNNVLREREPVTARLALRLAVLTGGSAKMWLNLQREYDLRPGNRKVVPTGRAW